MAFSQAISFLAIFWEVMMKKFVLGMVMAVAVAIGAVDANAGFTQFNPSGGSAINQDDGFLNLSFSNFTPLRTNDTVLANLTFSSASVRTYTVNYTFQSAFNSNSSFQLVASTLPSGWHIRKFSSSSSGPGLDSAVGTVDPTTSGVASSVTGTTGGSGNMVDYELTYSLKPTSETFLIDGAFSGSVGNATGYGMFIQIEYDSPVPEPTTMAIFGIGAAGFAVRRFRRK